MGEAVGTLVEFPIAQCLVVCDQCHSLGRTRDLGFEQRVDRLVGLMVEHLGIQAEQQVFTLLARQHHQTIECPAGLLLQGLDQRHQRLLHQLADT